MIYNATEDGAPSASAPCCEAITGKKLKVIPKFVNEDEKREFWLTHDTTDHSDHSNALE